MSGILLVCGDPEFKQDAHPGTVQHVMARLFQRLEPDLVLVTKPGPPMAAEFAGLMGISWEWLEVPKKEWDLRPWGKGRDAPVAAVAFTETPDELTNELLGRCLRWKVPGVYLVDGEEFLNCITGETAPCG